MKPRYFATLIPSGHPLSDNNYVFGRISATFRIVCNMDDLVCYGLLRGDVEETCMVVETTEEQYEKAKDIIEAWYPNLCVFDYPLEDINTTIPDFLF